VLAVAGQATSEVEERIAANEGAGWLRSPAHGGNGGTAFSDDLTEAARLLGFVIRSGSRVDSIQAIYQRADGTSFSGPQHGGNGGTQQAFAFAEDEFVTKVSGRAGSELDQISITTSRTTYGPFGGGGGKTWEFDSTDIGGIFGRSGSMVDQIGFFYK
jgi:hypothetical protein